MHSTHESRERSTGHRTDGMRVEVAINTYSRGSFKYFTYENWYTFDLALAFTYSNNSYHYQYRSVLSP